MIAHTYHHIYGLSMPSSLHSARDDVGETNMAVGDMLLHFFWRVLHVEMLLAKMGSMTPDSAILFASPKLHIFGPRRILPGRPPPSIGNNGEV